MLNDNQYPIPSLPRTNATAFDIEEGVYTVGVSNVSLSITLEDVHVE